MYDNRCILASPACLLLGCVMPFGFAHLVSHVDDSSSVLVKETNLRILWTAFTTVSFKKSCWMVGIDELGCISCICNLRYTGNLRYTDTSHVSCALVLV